MTYGIRLVNKGTTAHPRIRLTIFSQHKLPRGNLREIADEISWRFDLNSCGVPKFIRRFQHDRYLGPIIRRRPGMRAKSGYSLYEYLIVVVLLQNTVVRRSVLMLQALFERYGRPVTFDGRTLWAFWDPSSIDRASEEDLRALKLGYRTKTLKRQAEDFVAGNIDDRALRGLRDEATLAEALDHIYGVGPQSAWYMLFEFFHFYNALEHISPWEAKIVGRLVLGRSINPQRIHTFFTKRYGEFRQLAFHYIMADLFWQHHKRPIAWLSKLIRL